MLNRSTCPDEVSINTEHFDINDAMHYHATYDRYAVSGTFLLGDVFTRHGFSEHPPHTEHHL